MYTHTHTHTHTHWSDVWTDLLRNRKNTLRNDFGWCHLIFLRFIALLFQPRFSKAAQSQCHGLWLDRWVQTFSYDTTEHCGRPPAGCETGNCKNTSSLDGRVSITIKLWLEETVPFSSLIKSLTESSLDGNTVGWGYRRPALTETFSNISEKTDLPLILALIFRMSFLPLLLDLRGCNARWRRAISGEGNQQRKRRQRQYPWDLVNCSACERGWR